MDDDNSRISIPRVLTNRKILRIKYGHPTKSLVDGGKTRISWNYHHPLDTLALIADIFLTTS